MCAGAATPDLTGREPASLLHRPFLVEMRDPFGPTKSAIFEQAFPLPSNTPACHVSSQTPQQHESGLNGRRSCKQQALAVEGRGHVPQPKHQLFSS